MLKTIVFMALGIAAGFTVAIFMGDRAELAPAPAGGELSGDVGDISYDEFRPLMERVAMLEAALQNEISVRESLERELATLGERIAGVDSEEPNEPRGMGRGDFPEEGFDRAFIQERIAERGGFGRRDDPERRQVALVEAGFSSAEAQRITERESELQLASLYAQYDAVRSGEPLNLRDWLSTEDQLRQELGDLSYERYLEATGQSTAVGIRQVMSGSAGEMAGLQAGDQIVAYGGQRVFDSGDLNRLTLEGSPGETVVVDVLRGGQQIQVYVLRGPIGITGGGGFGGGMGR